MLQTFRELYKYRALVWALTVRHLSMRYRGSVLGFLWSFLNPLCLMLVYTLVFQYYVRTADVQHYTIFLFCGLLPWLWISSGVIEGTSSIVSSGHLITKSMFPAHILPTVACLTTMVNFLLSLPLLFIFMLFAGMPFHLSLIALPLVIFAQFAMLLGMSLALSALNVQYRDIQHIIANLLTLLFFLCPIIYPASSVPARFRFTLTFNPLALLTTMYHQLVIDGVWPSSTAVTVLACAAMISLLVGNIIYNHYRESFAELL
jgi:lipopolysaccharide transport system permease protein